MTRNIGKTDQLVRTVIAIILLVSFVKTDRSLTMNWLFLAGSLLLLSTSFFKYCPLYHLFDFSTHSPKKQGH
ncbi:YgaP family membrane protein [Spirosoma litoris]